MHARAAKNNALKAIKSNNCSEHEYDEDVEVIDREDENSYTVPITSQNAPEGFTLDLFKQYKRQVEFCDRDMIRIHDKVINKNDKISKLITTMASLTLDHID